MPQKNDIFINLLLKKYFQFQRKNMSGGNNFCFLYSHWEFLVEKFNCTETVENVNKCWGHGTDGNACYNWRS